MSSPLTRKSADHSNLKQFSFSFYCDHCGAEWKSSAIPFESGGFTAVDHEEARQLIWAQEHKTAFDRANLEAHFHFNHCPESGVWVCDGCFDAEGKVKNEIYRECS